MNATITFAHPEDVNTRMGKVSFTHDFASGYRSYSW